jgi:hypothetical protein
MLTRLFLGLTVCSALLSAQPINFLRDIRPLLSNNCFSCHGPDSASRMAGVRLDEKAHAYAQTANGTLVVPGNPDASLLYQRISAADASRRMPPAYSGKELTVEQVETLRRWIAAGAPWAESWFLTNPTRPAAPQVSDEAWVRNPIDSFILAALDQAGLKPAPEADRRTLIRRLALDLTGLPPTPEEVESFVNDKGPQAYEKRVDYYMAKPAYGEHRGRYWLDAARYADTHGLHIDNYREMWPYRDWVINAFNRNMPFDQFTIEQLAGDLLPNPTRDQLIATGFHRCNVTTNEGGVIEEEVAAIYAKDRVDTTSAVWLGLTVGCATCHDHKFDPIKQTDFYSMGAFFRNTTQKTLDGNIFDPGPVVTVRSKEDEALWAELRAREQAAREALTAAEQSSQAGFENWLSSGAYRQANVDRLDNSSVLSVDFANNRRSLASSVSVTVEVARRGRAAAWVGEQGVIELADAPEITADKPLTLSLTFYLPEDKSAGPLISRTDPADKNRGWVLSVDDVRPAFAVTGERGERIGLRAEKPFVFTRNQWNHVAVTYDGSQTLEGIQLYLNGQPVPGETVVHGLRTVDGPLDNNVPLWLGAVDKSHFDGLGVTGLEVLNRVASEQEIQLLAVWPELKTATRKAAAELTEAEKRALHRNYLLRESAAYREQSVRLAAVIAQERDVRRRSAVTHVMEEKADSTPFAHVLIRGMYDQLGERVEASTPSALPPMAASLPRNRLGLARWLVDDSNPLTARVTVNRYWQEIFGAGIVPTSEDFGSQGQPPSNPELLDWLAVEFRENGWNIKDFFRLMVTSSTYRQTAAATPAKLEKDPLNVLLSRGPRFRMDAEVVRDYALAASGLLVDHVGGPSVKPYQPERIWETVAMPQSNTQFYSQDHGQALYRRSVYTFWKRSAPPPALEIFNAPTREQCTVRRERTNTPLQALLTMNATGFVEAARHLAEAAETSSADFDSRLDFMTARVLARLFNARERGIVRGAFQDYLNYYESNPGDAGSLLSVGESPLDGMPPRAELAALTMVANQLLNLDEALNK